MTYQTRLPFNASSEFWEMWKFAQANGVSYEFFLASWKNLNYRFVPDYSEIYARTSEGASNAK